MSHLYKLGNRWVVKEGGWARLAMECEGEVGTLRAIVLDMPSPAPYLDASKMVLEDLGSGARSGSETRIQDLI